MKILKTLGCASLTFLLFAFNNPRNAIQIQLTDSNISKINQSFASEEGHVQLIETHSEEFFVVIKEKNVSGKKPPITKNKIGRE